MRTAVCLMILGAFVVQARAQSITAESLLQDSQERVSALERKADSTNGTLTVAVSFKASILGKKASGDAKYRITVKNGQDTKNELMKHSVFSDSTAAAMMDRQFRHRLNKSMMGFYLDTAFPWSRYLARANKKREFNATVDSDSAVVAGKTCFLISFTLDAEGDMMRAEGKGKIWLDAQTLLPVRTYRDFEMKTRRGNAEVKSSSDFSALENGVPVLLKSETQTIPKFLFISVGSIKTLVEQSDFNLE